MAGRKTLVSLLIGLWLALSLAGCSGETPNQQKNTNHPAQSALKGQVTGVPSGEGSDRTPSPTSKTAKLPGRPAAQPEKTSVAGPAAPSAGVEKIPSAGPEAISADPVREGEDAPARVRLVVTRDFGQSLISDRWLMLAGSTTALAVTTGNLATQTAYGGTFITSIDGIASGYTGKAAWNKEKVDWFLYYNGKMAGTGADQIKLKAGDVIWWDYHDWSGEPKPLPAEPPSR